MEIKLATAYETGISHLLYNLPCQDRAAGRVGDEVSVIALSDGAGSCTHSEEAAQKITEWALEYIPQHFEELYHGVPDLNGAALVQDGQEALMELGRPLRECYCTFLFFGVHRDGRWLCGHIGDGVIFFRDEDGTRVLSHPQNGTYHNETYFLSQDCAWEHFRLQTGKLSMRTDTAVLLTSDGGAEVLYNWENRTPAPAVTTISGWLREHEQEEVEKALHEDFRERFSMRSDDDLSIALLYYHI